MNTKYILDFLFSCTVSKTYFKIQECLSFHMPIYYCQSIHKHHK